MNRPLKNYLTSFIVFLLLLFIVSLLAALYLPFANKNLSSHFMFDFAFVFITLFPLAIVLSIFFSFRNLDAGTEVHSSFFSTIEKPFYAIIVLLLVYFLFHFLMNGYLLDALFQNLNKQNNMLYTKKHTTMLGNMNLQARKLENEKKYDEVVGLYMAILKNDPYNMQILAKISEVNKKKIEEAITPEKRIEIVTLEARADSYFNDKKFAQAKLVYEKLLRFYPKHEYRDSVKKCEIGIRNKEAKLTAIEQKDMEYFSDLNVFIGYYRENDIYGAYNTIIELVMKYPDKDEISDYYEIMQKKITEDEFVVSLFLSRTNFMERYDSLIFSQDDLIYSAEEMYISDEIVYFRKITVNDKNAGKKEEYRYGKIINDTFFLKNHEKELSTVKKLQLDQHVRFMRFLHEDNYMYLFFSSPFQFYGIKRLAVQLGHDRFIYSLLIIVKFTLPLFIISILFLFFFLAYYLKGQRYSIMGYLFIIFLVIVSFSAYAVAVYISNLIGYKAGNPVISYVVIGVILCTFFIVSIVKIIRVKLVSAY
ncbi:tetratricopeptide repeat protein [Spirochaetota bacterium]